MVTTAFSASATSRTSVLQASRSLPVITMASDPHTPWPQLLRNERLPSCSPFTRMRASRRRGRGLDVQRVVPVVRGGVRLRAESPDAQHDSHVLLSLRFSTFRRLRASTVEMSTGREPVRTLPSSSHARLCRSQRASSRGGIVVPRVRPAALRPLPCRSGGEQRQVEEVAELQDARGGRC